MQVVPALGVIFLAKLHGLLQSFRFFSSLFGRQKLHMCCFISAEAVKNILLHLLPKKSVMAWIPTKRRNRPRPALAHRVSGHSSKAMSEASEIFSSFCRI